MPPLPSSSAVLALVLCRASPRTFAPDRASLYVTVNFDEERRPFEVFCALGKAGSVESAHMEAIARLISMSLRSGVAPEQVVEHLRGITDEPVWDGGTLVRSVPDAISLVLDKYITDKPTTDAPTAQIGLFPSSESVGSEPIEIDHLCRVL